MVVLGEDANTWLASQSSNPGHCESTGHICTRSCGSRCCAWAIGAGTSRSTWPPAAQNTGQMATSCRPASASSANTWGKSGCISSKNAKRTVQLRPWAAACCCNAACSSCKGCAQLAEREPWANSTSAVGAAPWGEPSGSAKEGEEGKEECGMD